jgi:hypothetical protein
MNDTTTRAITAAGGVLIKEEGSTMKLAARVRGKE